MPTPDTGSSTQDPGAASPGSESGSESMGDGSEPGFSDIAGADALPDMRDELPTFEESYGGGDGTDSASGAAEADGGNGESARSPSGTENTAQSGPGTRADGGMEGVASGSDIMTTAEQVAILDRQLEQSTSDFDAMILEEQQRQREEARERANRNAQREQPEPAGAGTSGRSPYNDDVAMGEQTKAGGTNSGGIAGKAKPPTRDESYEIPDDIPDPGGDDAFATKLRERAMSEPNPVVREGLWNEYRVYKGLEIPE